MPGLFGARDLQPAQIDGQEVQLARDQVQELAPGIEYPRSVGTWSPARLWYDKCRRDPVSSHPGAE
jgi:hypothetical protein